MTKTSGWAVAVLLTVSCAGSHETVDPEADGGMPVDARVDMRVGLDGEGVDSNTPQCRLGETPPNHIGCIAVSNYHCSDSAVPPECINGVWECTVPNDGTPCMCYGGLPSGCYCTAHGQECEYADMGPPDAGIRRFLCGAFYCLGATEYCQHSLSDVSGIPDDYACIEYPSTCSVHTCACFDSAPGPGPCSEDADGNVTITAGGG